MKLGKILIIALAGFMVVKYTPIGLELNTMYLNMRSRADKHDRQSEKKGDNIRSVFGQ